MTSYDFPLPCPERLPAAAISALIAPLAVWAIALDPLTTPLRSL